MKIVPLVVAASSLLACAAAATPRPTPATPQPGTMSAQPPSTPARSDDFLEAVRQGDEERALAMLTAEPAVASARTLSGNSVYLVALLRVSAGGFTQPASN